VGLNVYTLAGIARDVPMSDIFKGVTPFLLGIFLLVIILTVFPQIVTFLPGMMGR
jgi:TRAP-type C4-dicarboxylate transport system permease large subunit